MKVISTSSYQPIQHSFHKEKNKNKMTTQREKNKHTQSHSIKTYNDTLMYIYHFK